MGRQLQLPHSVWLWCLCVCSGLETPGIHSSWSTVGWNLKIKHQKATRNKKKKTMLVLSHMTNVPLWANAVSDHWLNARPCSKCGLPRRKQPKHRKVSSCWWHMLSHRKSFLEATLVTLILYCLFRGYGTFCSGDTEICFHPWWHRILCLPWWNPQFIQSSTPATFQIPLRLLLTLSRT